MDADGTLYKEEIRSIDYLHLPQYSRRSKPALNKLESNTYDANSTYEQSIQEEDEETKYTTTLKKSTKEMVCVGIC